MQEIRCEVEYWLTLRIGTGHPPNAAQPRWASRPRTALSRLTTPLPDLSFGPSWPMSSTGRWLSLGVVEYFLILHYRRGERRNSEFRRHCANMSIPDGLAPQIEPFRRTGRVAILEPEGFAEPSWVPILMGLGVMPERYDPMWICWTSAWFASI
jgi:hypothetical protein